MSEVPILTGKEVIVLRLLITNREMHGLDLVDESDGSLKDGTIYLTLERMRKRGYIEWRKEPPKGGVGRPRKVYWATGVGERAYRAHEAAEAARRNVFEGWTPAPDGAS